MIDATQLSLPACPPPMALLRRRYLTGAWTLPPTGAGGGEAANVSGNDIPDRIDTWHAEHDSIGHYPAVSARIVLVRHCESAVNPEAPPSTWGLTERGLRQARSLVDLCWVLV